MLSTLNCFSISAIRVIRGSPPLFALRFAPTAIALWAVAPNWVKNLVNKW
jgi:hypothetical protein